MTFNPKSWLHAAKNSLVRLEAAIHSTINGMVETLPDTLDSMSQGWVNNPVVDPVKQREKLLRRFVAQDKVLFGADSPYRIGSLLALATWYRGQYRLGDARGLYEEAWRLATLSGEHARIVDTTLVLAEFLDLLGRNEQVAACFEEAWNLVGESVDAKLKLQLLDAWARWAEQAEVWITAARVRRLGIDVIERSQGPLAEMVYLWVCQLHTNHSKLGESQAADLRARQLTCLAALQGRTASDADSIWRIRDLEELARLHTQFGNQSIAKSLRAHARFIRVYHKALGDALPRMPEVEEACAFLMARGNSGDESLALRLKHAAAAKHERHKNRTARR